MKHHTKITISLTLLTLIACEPKSNTINNEIIPLPKNPDQAGLEKLFEIMHDKNILSQHLKGHTEEDIEKWSNYFEDNIAKFAKITTDTEQICTSLDNLKSHNLIKPERDKNLTTICLEFHKENNKIKEAYNKNQEIERERDDIRRQIAENERSLENLFHKINLFKKSYVYLSGIATQEIDFGHYEIRVQGEQGVLIGDLTYDRLPSRFNFWVRGVGTTSVQLRNGRTIKLPTFEVVDRTDFDLAVMLYSSLEQDLHNLRRAASRPINSHSAPEAQKRVAELGNALLLALRPEPKQETAAVTPTPSQPSTAPLPDVDHPLPEQILDENSRPDEDLEINNPEDEDININNITPSTLNKQEREQLVNSLLTGPPTSDFYWRLHERRVESFRFLGQTKQLETYVTSLLEDHKNHSEWLLANLAHGCEDAGENECAANAHNLLIQNHDTPHQRIDTATFWLTTTPADIALAERLLAELPTPPPAKLTLQLSLLQADINARRGETSQALNILQNARSRANSKIIDAALERLNASPPQPIISPRRSPPRPFRTPRLWAGSVPTGAWSDDELATGFIFESIVQSRGGDLRTAHGLLDAASLLNIKYDTRVELQLLRGKLMEQAGEHTTALAHYSLLVQQNPADPKLLGRLAWTLLTIKSPELRDVTRAHQLAQKAAESTARQDPSILDTLAEAEAQGGDFSTAQKILEECMQLEPSRDYYQKRFDDFAKKTTKHALK